MGMTTVTCVKATNSSSTHYRHLSQTVSNAELDAEAKTRDPGFFPLSQRVQSAETRPGVQLATVFDDVCEGSAVEGPVGQPKEKWMEETGNGQWVRDQIR
jgi:hypothetical protein